METKLTCETNLCCLACPSSMTMIGVTMMMVVMVMMMMMWRTILWGGHICCCRTIIIIIIGGTSYRRWCIGRRWNGNRGRRRGAWRRCWRWWWWRRRGRGTCSTTISIWYRWRLWRRIGAYYRRWGNHRFRVNIGCIRFGSMFTKRWNTSSTYRSSFRWLNLTGFSSDGGVGGAQQWRR